VGVNSYGGAMSLPERLRKAGWTKPFVVTEFGPLGPWESPKTGWGAPVEANSTEKAIRYGQEYGHVVADNAGWCLGSYAFLWGHKQETTPTWFGMFLPTGEATGAVDEISKGWTGSWPKNRAPKIETFTFSEAGKHVKPNTVASFDLSAKDSDEDP